MSEPSLRPVQRLKLTIAYRGTRYHGWQQQSVSENQKGARVGAAADRARLRAGQ